MSSPMKVGLIGCGAFASGTHLPNVAANPEFEITALCDLNESLLRELDKQYHPRYVTTDMRRMMQDPAIETIICSTKPDSRLLIMRAAVEHRKHLFVEKPLCYREDEIRVMVPLMRSAPIKFMVGFNRPYSPLMQAVKPVFQKWRRGNTTLIYRIVGEAQLWPASHYNAVVNKGESTIVHEATHIFDLLNWLTDSLPTRVYAAGGGNMDNIITLNYPGDITAVVVSGDNSSAGFPKERLEINTNHATIIGDDFVELWAAGVEEQSFRQPFPYTLAGQTYTDGARGAADKLWEWRKSVTPEERAYGYYYNRIPRVDKGHYNELEFFRRSIREDQPSPTDVIRGAAAGLIAWRAVDSWQSGRAVDLDFGYLYA